MPILNFEPICAQWGRAMVEAPTKNNSLADQENTIAKALSVLVGNGVYAMGIFLLSRGKKDYAERILTKYLAGLWRECGVLKAEQDPGGEEEMPPDTDQEEYDHFLLGESDTLDRAIILTIIEKKIATDLPRLILAKKLAEQTMIFARYHAKAEIASPPAT